MSAVGAAEGAQGWGEEQGHPGPAPASHSLQAVIKGDTGLRKDLQSPLNLQPSLK